MRIKNFYSRVILVSIFVLSLILAMSFSHLKEGLLQAKTNDSLPTLVYTNPQGEQVLAPDFNNLSFSDLPTIEEAGWIRIPRDFVAQIGYDPSRAWDKFANVADVVMLGDIEDAFGVGRFSLQSISDITHLNLKKVALSEFQIIKQQTIEDLVKAIPDLQNLKVFQVRPIADLLTQVSSSDPMNEMIGTIAKNPAIAALPLGKYLNLSKYSLDSIPGLSTSPLQAFRGWQQSSVTGILGNSGLSSVPFSAFPVGLLNRAFKIAQVDVVWGNAEHGDSKVPSNLFISGAVKDKSDRTIPVPCTTDQPCPYIELTNTSTNPLDSFHGKRWVVGGSKGIWVKEGYGPLANLNNGWGAAGVTVFGANFGKVTILETDESTGKVKVGLYLRVCTHIPFLGKSCSPYFIGPISLDFLNTKEKGFVIVSS